LKNYFLILFLIICQNVFCQDYHFDYYTVYDYQKEEKGTTTKEIYYSNTKDISYIFFVKIVDNKITDCYVTDYKNEKLLFFTTNDFSDMANFQFVKSTNYSLEECRNTKNYEYQIDYISDKGTNKINIKKFKKKKLMEESFYFTQPPTITQQQHYNLGILATPIWCEKIKLNNEEIISSSYFMRNGKKEHIRNLLEIKPISFDLKVN